MHIGRLWQIEQRLRVFMGDTSYPRWLATDYTLDVIAANAWQGTAPLPTGIPATGYMYNSTLCGTQEFAYAVNVGTFGGRIIHFGFLGYPTQVPTISYSATTMAWSDGVEQHQRAAILSKTGGYQELRNTVQPVPVAGAVAYNRSQVKFIRVPW